MNLPYHNIYSGRRVFVTGHTGFKGSWLSLWLHRLGARVTGFGLAPPACGPNFHELIGLKIFENTFTADIRQAGALADALHTWRPEIVFHLAAQPIVRLSYSHPVETFSTNVLGTIFLLEAIRAATLRCPVIVVTSDKCYANCGWEWGYRESDPLGGQDVYSMSKAAVELVVQSWRGCFFHAKSELGPVATVRAGNVIGGGDYGEARILPDCVRALLAGKPVSVRNPTATRPWQHVLDCLSGYLWLGAELLAKEHIHGLAGAFNFGPAPRSARQVRDLVKEFLSHWPGTWVEESGQREVLEDSHLRLNTDRAAQRLQWFPTWDFNESVLRTAHWYHARHMKNEEMFNYSTGQIDEFTDNAVQQRYAWAVSI
jgi:CDP-glucose 4,6-dehydratase